MTLYWVVAHKLKHISRRNIHSFIDWSKLLFTRRQKEFFFSLSLSPDDDFAPAGLTLFHRESVNWKSGTKTTNRVQKYCWEFLNGSQLFWLSFPSTASAPFAHLSYLLSRSLIVITPSENDFLAGTFAIRSLPYLFFVLSWEKISLQKCNNSTRFNLFSACSYLLLPITISSFLFDRFKQDV